MTNPQNPDRELLELAAKAAGIDLQWMGEGRMAACFDPAGENEWWNPLTDDGDALRLMAKLRLDVCRPHSKHAEVCVWSDARSDFICEPDEVDPAAATRRAIVRAAAEIGKAMP